MATGRGENEVVAQCLAGRETAWEDLYRRYAPYVRGIIRLPRWGFPEHTHDDILQETFLSVVRALKSFRGESTLKTFICRVAVKTCLFQRRRLYAARRSPLLEADLPAERLESLADDRSQLPHERMMREESSTALRNAVQAMEARCRRLIDMRFYQDLSYEEIARAENLPMGTVGVTLGRCLRKLQAILREKGWV